MPILTRNANHTVRQGSPWTVPWAIYVVAFLGAGAAAYWRGNSATEQAQESSPASTTAVVRLREPIVGRSAQPPGPALAGGPESAASSLRDRRLAPDHVRQQIVSLAGDHAQESLRVETAATSTPGELKVSIAMPRRPQQEAVPTVNTLAQAFATAYRAEWRASVEQAYRDAHETADRAQQQVRESKLQLDTMLDRQAQAAREAAAKLAAARAAGRSPASPGMVDNPDWVEQNQQLGEMRQRRRALLNDRTPLHPAVQDLDNRIEQLERQMAAIPRQIPAGASGAVPAPPAPPQVEEPAIVAQPNPAEVQKLQQIAEQANRLHEEAIKAEQQAWQMRLQEPAIDLELAQIEPSLPRSGISAWLAALAVGVTMVTGLGMISTAMAIELPVATMAELEAALPVPIVGLVPQLDPTRASAGRSRGQRLLRMVLVVAGLLVLAGCLAMLVAVGVKS